MSWAGRGVAERREAGELRRRLGQELSSGFSIHQWTSLVDEFGYSITARGEGTGHLAERDAGVVFHSEDEILEHAGIKMGIAKNSSQRY